jgi:hypothetical protein
METSTAITSDDLDLEPVFGALDAETRERVLAELRRGDEALRAVAAELGIESEGLVLSTYPSGQTEVAATLRAAGGKLSFEVGLRPRNFFSPHNPWRPGQPPRPMQTDAWDVDGAVNVMVRRLVGQHKYTIQEQAVELETTRYESPVEAAAALAACCERLAELARSREATVEAWAAPDPSAPR